MNRRKGNRRKEAVNHPAHYGGKDNPYEFVKYAEATGLDKDAYLFNTGKYIHRKDNKAAALQDLEKALWYLNRRIQLMKGVVFHVTTPPWERNYLAPLPCEECGGTEETGHQRLCPVEWAAKEKRDGLPKNKTKKNKARKNSSRGKGPPTI